MDKLKARIDKMFKTRAEFASAIGMSPSALSRALSSGNWSLCQLERVVKVLKIPAKDIPSYFFTSYVANNAKEKV